ncbi:MAG: M16 family metallopeptidase [Prevotella sp.]
METLFNKNMKYYTQLRNLLILCIWQAFVFPADAQQINPALQVTEIKLTNGLKVWVNQDYSQPTVFGAVVVNAGAIDCPNTGIAHYFEHIMFKGTDSVGTVDYVAEKVWLDSIAHCYGQLGKTTDASAREEIQKHINQLSIKASEYAIPNEFNRLVTCLGGSNLNAATSQDITFYHNSFIPTYLEPWCELNSHRLIHPVFRLFQGELETVYEEKNMGSDRMLGTALDTIISKIFSGTPYAYSVIGSTENLKNPNLADMQRFFEQYYVAGNMTLVLCGAVPDAETMRPMLERTFGRLRPGTAPQRNHGRIRDFAGNTEEILLPIPLIKGEVMLYHAPGNYDADAPAVDMALSILSNEGETGLLDSLTNAHKAMMLTARRLTFGSTGVCAGLIVPNLVGSREKTEELFVEQVERLKKGDFTEETLQKLKVERHRSVLTQMETIEGRSMMMIEALSEGKNWNDVLALQRRYDEVTKQEVMDAANRYLNHRFMRLVKKYGSYPKDQVSQPGYEPVIPKHRHSSSQYATRMMERYAGMQDTLRLVDMKHDVHALSIYPQVTLYVKENTVNDVFNLDLVYRKGEREDAVIGVLASMMDKLGTDSLSRQAFNLALQRVGATLSTQETPVSFSIHLEGIDKQFREAVSLLGHFISSLQVDEAALQQVKDDAKLANKSFEKDNNNVWRAALDKVLFGAASDYLKGLSYKDVKALKTGDVAQCYHRLLARHCDVVYSGTLSAADVCKVVETELPLKQCVEPVVDSERTLLTYAEPIVYFYNLPKMRQTIVTSFQSMPAAANDRQRALLSLWGNYFGGSMSSVLFQEMREFRSMCYSASGWEMLPDYLRHAGNPAGYVTRIGTQGDKVMEVLDLADSLLNVPEISYPIGVDVARHEALNSINKDYPTFREIGKRVAQWRAKGYEEQPSARLVRILPQITVDDLNGFIESNVANKPRVYILVGNRKQWDMKRLASFGKLVELKKKDIVKQ